MNLQIDSEEIAYLKFLQSVKMADRNIQPGHLYLKKGRVEGANINRSPTSYDANPEEEKSRQVHSRSFLHKKTYHLPTYLPTTVVMK